MFPVGSTTVTCSVTDALQRTASCSFAVAVVGPHLGPTTFLAFGDSITAGEVPDSTDSSTGGRVRLRMLQPSLAYPAQLQTMLQQRYPTQAQAIMVINRGIQGEWAVQGAARLDGELTQFKPDVLLLLEGVNDLDGSGEAAAPAALDAIRSMIRDAQHRGVKVIVATLLPQVPPLERAFAPGLIAPFNDQLVQLVLSERALVADLYADFILDTTDWISPLDGLHPTPAGYQEMARVFFNTINTAYASPGSTTPAFRGRHPASAAPGVGIGRVRR
jgi:lysophospholipase L1-like esterase